MATKQDSSESAGPDAAPAPPATASTSKSPSSSTSGPDGKQQQTKDQSKDLHDESDAGTTLPLRGAESYQQFLINKSIAHDHIHAAAIISDRDRQNDLNKHRYKEVNDYRMLRNEYKPWFTPAKLYGEGYSGYGNGRTDTPHARLIYPHQKQRPGKRTTPPLRWKRKDMKQQADQHEELVPVRLDVDWDKIKLRDTFTWNLHERIVPVELFAMQLVEDMALKPPVSQHVYEQVFHQMNEQLNDFYPFVFSDEDALDPELPYSAWKNDEMRILVKLNITIGQHTLVDQFEWEINNPLNSPEEFAASMSKELALSGEFTTAIAHCIREQTQLFTRSLYSVGHPFDGRPIEDADLVAAFLPSPLLSVFRPQQQAKEYAPYLYELNDVDLERNEMVFSREQRRQKRSINRRGGPTLPDLKERQRTIRTLVVSDTLPGAATNVEDSRLYKKAAGAPGGRRRGAARDGDISDSEESDDSSPESPAPSQLTGTARTRGMRGAASAAQQRMANIGRSETPEATIHHHETRTSRRFGRELTREDTEEPQQLIVTLKVPADKLRRLVRSKQNTPAGSLTPSQAHARAPSTAANMPPPSTPNSMPGRASSSSVPPPAQVGRVDAPPPPPTGAQPPPPPPPTWLVEALDKFRREDSYAKDQFEAFMRYTAMDSNSGSTVPMPQHGQPIPANIRFYFMPRIRCLDCPGKMYTPGPEMTAGNFEVHLKNKQHKEKVEARLRTGSATPAAAT